MKTTLALLFAFALTPLNACTSTQVAAIPEACPTSFTAEESVQKIRSWEGAQPIAEWATLRSEIKDTDCGSSSVTLSLTASTPKDTSTRGTSYEGTFYIEVDRTTGAPNSSDKHKATLLEAVQKINAVIIDAEKDPAIKKWLSSNTGATGQLRPSNDNTGYCAFYWVPQNTSTTQWCPKI